MQWRFGLPVTNARAGSPYVAKWLALVSLTAVLGTANLAAASPSGLSFPQSMELTEVAESMVSNGIPMRVYGFRSHQRIERVLEETRRHLDERGYDVGNVLSLGRMKTLGASDDRNFINIQGERSEYGHGSAGFVVITPIMNMFDVERPQPSMPLPEDLDVVSHDLFDDGGRSGESVLAITPRFADEAGKAVVEGLRADGWRPARHEITVDDDEVALYRILTKGERSCRILALDEILGGQPMGIVNINCHD